MKLTWNTHESLSLRSEKIDEFLARRVPAADADHAKAGAATDPGRALQPLRNVIQYMEKTIKLFETATISIKERL